MVTGEYHNSFLWLYVQYMYHTSSDVLHTQVDHILLHHGNENRSDGRNKK